MAKNEKTSKPIATIASNLLRNSKNKDVRRVAASVLTQTADKGKKK